MSERIVWADPSADRFPRCVRAACSANTRGFHTCTYPDCKCTMEPIIVRAILEELER